MALNAQTERVIRPSRGYIGLNLAELWRYRELLGLFTWRDILVRYKQTALGVIWAVLQPLLTMLVFAMLFGRMLKVETWGAPYAIMALAALVPWTFFANALTESSASLVAQSRIISKVYFPRLIVPVSSVLGGLVDVVIASVLLLIFMPFYGVGYSWKLLLVPLFLFATMLSALAVGLWLSALNVKYRDVRYVVPFITRIGMYASPVPFLWQVIVPENWKLLYHANPLVGLIDGVRWCVLGEKFAPWWPGFALGMGVTLVLLATGLIYFRQVEKTFADIV